MKIVVLGFDGGFNNNTTSNAIERIKELVSSKLRDPVVPCGDGKVEVVTHIQPFSRLDALSMLNAKKKIALVRPDAVLVVTNDGVISKAANRKIVEASMKAAKASKRTSLTSGSSKNATTIRVAKFSPLVKETSVVNGKISQRPTLAKTISGVIKKANWCNNAVSKTAEVDLFDIPECFNFLRDNSSRRLFSWIHFSSSSEESSSSSIETCIIGTVLAALHGFVAYEEEKKAQYDSNHGCRKTKSFDPSSFKRTSYWLFYFNDLSLEGGGTCSCDSYSARSDTNKKKQKQKQKRKQQQQCRVKSLIPASSSCSSSQKVDKVPFVMKDLSLDNINNPNYPSDSSSSSSSSSSRLSKEGKIRKSILKKRRNKSAPISCDGVVGSSDGQLSFSKNRTGRRVSWSADEGEPITDSIFAS